MTDDLAKPGPQDGAKARRTFSVQAIHLLRTVQLNTLQLSQMADQKASILMGATLVVFTISVGQASGGELPTSLAVLALFAFASALCAIIAVLPSTGGRRVKGDDPDGNMLFFGHFTHNTEDEFTEMLLSRLSEDESLFRLIARDIYQNGQVLRGRKYRFLGYAYRIFMVGISITLIVFVAESI